ncbi:unnamed protein product [Closterium sp. NIES-65]|nr:unnamed protein product [Closterium sp. NIES-65]
MAGAAGLLPVLVLAALLLQAPSTASARLWIWNGGLVPFIPEQRAAEAVLTAAESARATGPAAGTVAAGTETDPPLSPPPAEVRRGGLLSIANAFDNHYVYKHIAVDSPDQTNLPSSIDIVAELRKIVANGEKGKYSRLVDAHMAAYTATLALNDGHSMFVLNCFLGTYDLPLPLMVVVEDGKQIIRVAPRRCARRLRATIHCSRKQHPIGVLRNNGWRLNGGRTGAAASDTSSPQATTLTSIGHKADIPVMDKSLKRHPDPVYYGDTSDDSDDLNVEIASLSAAADGSSGAVAGQTVYLVGGSTAVIWIHTFTPSDAVSEVLAERNVNAEKYMVQEVAKALLTAAASVLLLQPPFLLGFYFPHQSPFLLPLPVPLPSTPSSPPSFYLFQPPFLLPVPAPLPSTRSSPPSFYPFQPRFLLPLPALLPTLLFVSCYSPDILTSSLSHPPSFPYLLIPPCLCPCVPAHVPSQSPDAFPHAPHHASLFRSNATQIIIDVRGNGGSHTAAAYTAIRLLMGAAKVPDSEFSMPVDFIIGTPYTENAISALSLDPNTHYYYRGYSDLNGTTLTSAFDYAPFRKLRFTVVLC